MINPDFRSSEIVNKQGGAQIFRCNFNKLFGPGYF